MKTLHVIGELTRERGGPVAALRGLLEATAGPPFENSVLCADLRRGELPLPDGVHIHRFPLSFPKRFLRSAAALHWLRGHWRAYDLIILHEIWPFIVLEAGAMLANKRAPIAVFPHNSLDPLDLQKKRALKRVLAPLFVRPMLDACRMALAATEREARRFDFFGAHPPTGVLPLSVPDNVSGGNRAAFRRRFGIADDEMVVLFFGRLDQKKGVDILLRAVASMHGSAPDFRLVVAGSGREEIERALRGLADGLLPPERVVFTGFLSGAERADAFAGADVFVLPSRYENFGMAVIEAMHAGLPALISDQVFLSEEIRANNAALVCPPEEAAVAEALSSLLENPALRGELAAVGRRFAAGFLPEALGPSVRSRFLELAGKGGATP